MDSQQTGQKVQVVLPKPFHVANLSIFAVSAMVLTALAVAATSTDDLIGRSFAVALDDQPTLAVADPREPKVVQVAGTEAYWLENRGKASKRDLAPVTWTPNTAFQDLNPGDEIMFGVGSTPLEVISIIKTHGDAVDGKIKLDIVAREKNRQHAPLVSFSTTVHTTADQVARQRAL